MVTVESVDFKTSAEMALDEEIRRDGSLDLIKAAVRRFGREGTSGYDLVLPSNAPPGSGLGASSTTMVALTGLPASGECSAVALRPGRMYVSAWFPFASRLWPPKPV
jgi:galactokinase/mevalonate kinase-like predicted kinase